MSNWWIDSFINWHNTTTQDAQLTFTDSRRKIWGTVNSGESATLAVSGAAECGELYRSRTILSFNIYATSRGLRTNRAPALAGNVFVEGGLGEGDRKTSRSGRLSLAFETRYFHFQQVAIQGPRTDCERGWGGARAPGRGSFLFRDPPRGRKKAKRDLVTHRCHARRIYLASPAH